MHTIMLKIRRKAISKVKLTAWPVGKFLSRNRILITWQTWAKCFLFTHVRRTVL